MMIDIKAKNEQTGEILFEGTLNRNEVAFLLQYAVNDLMHAGVQFNLEPLTSEDEEVRFKFPDMKDFND